ncbi:MAG: hypothetical protein A4S09_10145 [Proteobacteria bacterium SG_bin7]|nr:MAG: hypothetical protein A4S09_10145 [Proteobacteria bacterium SG_bin7]
MIKKNLTILLSLTLISTLMSACGAKRPMEVVVKNDQEKVSTVSTTEDFIYLISVSDADSLAEASRPHWMSSSKLVRFAFNKTSLEVKQVVDDPRFKNNPTNEKSILSIPVVYKNYRCKQNDFKECTNKEESEEDSTWDKREYFLPDYERLQITEVSFLPLALDQITEGCFSQTSQKLISSELKPESLNIEIERTYSVKDISCAKSVLVGTLEELLASLSFKVRYHISIVKAAALTDSRYQEVIYPQGDQSMFGFFTTDSSRLDIDNRPSADKVITKLDRWSPNRKEIVYYLNDAFEGAEFAKIKSQTYKVADAVNAAFKEAGTSVDFKVKPAPKGMSGEDLRNSMIIMVPEAMDSGLLGYGPHASNPKTGEIVHGRVVMYLGNMKQFIHRTWDEIVLSQVNQKVPKAVPSGDTGSNSSETVSGPTQSVSFAGELLDLHPVTSTKKNAIVDSKSSFKLPDGVVVSSPVAAVNALTKFMKSTNSSKKALAGLEIDKGIVADDIDDYARKHLSDLEYYSNNNYYPADYFGFENAILSAFKGKIPENLLKTWSQMTESERAQVIDLVLPVAWTVTLIHEIGHTLGLRHNFSGSEDKDNFYSKEELKGHGIDHDIHISSVMEYPFEDIGALPIMGKYDVAALRFGYARKALLADGKTLVSIGEKGIKAKQEELEKELEKLPQDQQTSEAQKKYSLKSYDYCTDEHVDANPGCKRFDTGTNLKEIAQHQINIYDRYYKYRNFRYGRRFFNVEGDGAYLSRMMGSFRDMRLFFERYEAIKESIPNDELWEKDPNLSPQTKEYLKGLKEGINLIANHMMSVMVQPEPICLYRAKGDKQVRSYPLIWIQNRYANPFRSQYNPSVYSCLRDLRSNEQIQWVGQFGRYINSRKDPTTENPFVDEIDVRGIAIDKALASHFLMTRYLGNLSSDSTTGNFFDIPEQRERLKELYMAIILDEVPVKVSAALTDGSTVEIKEVMSMWWMNLFKPSASGRVNHVLGIHGETPFAEILLRQIDRYAGNIRDPEGSLELLREFQVTRNLNTEDIKARTHKKIAAADGNIFYIFPENTLAERIYERWEIATVLEPNPFEIQATLAEAFSKKTPREELSANLQKLVKDVLKVTDEKLAAALLKNGLETFDYLAKRGDGAKVMANVMTGLQKSKNFYEGLINALPDSRGGGRHAINANISIQVRGK